MRKLRYLAKRFFLIVKVAIGTFVRLLASKQWPEPRAAREQLEALGGMFIKLGQLLASRADKIPESYAREFIRLLDNTVPIGNREIAPIFIEELGAAPEKLFTSFESTPIASASFGQVHQARLSTGELVAVKIQRPDMKAVVRFDLFILAVLAKLVDAVRPFYAAYSVVRQLRSWTLRELQYRKEAAMTDYFYQRQEKFPGARFPKVFWEFTTERILTTEFIAGTPFTRLNETVPFALRKHIAEALFGHQLFAFFLEGFFHGDPHPSNLILTERGELGYVDFGLFGETSLRERKVFAEFMYAVVRNEVAEAVTGLLDFSEVTMGVHPDEFFNYLWKISLRARPHVSTLRKAFRERLTRELTPLMRHWHESFSAGTAAARDAAMLTGSIGVMAGRYGLAMPRLTLFARTLMIMQGVVENYLGVVVNIAEATRQFFEEHIEAIRALPEPLLAAEPQDPRLAEAWQVRQELLKERREIEKEIYFDRLFGVLERLAVESEA